MPLFLHRNALICPARSLAGLALRVCRAGIAGSSLAGLLLLAPGASAQSIPRQIENLRLWHSPDRTRIVFDVSANVKHRIFSLQDPLRLVVDIENADLPIKLPQLDINNEHISALRSGRPDDKRLRFVFELKKPLKTHDFVLSPNELYGHRLVVDLEEDGSALAANTYEELIAGPGSIAEPMERDSAATNNRKMQTIVEANRADYEPATSEPIIATAAGSRAVVNVKETYAQPILIAIDAGHGGEDSGALGYRGSREKKITLEIANILKKIVDDDPQMRAFMVRQGDYYIKLNRRRQMARDAQADMFISIHADAFHKRSAHGFSVFALSQSGATSAMAQALAAKENASDLIGGVSLADKDEVLAKVLVDLSMTNTISESVNLGGRVLKELGKLGKLHSKRVEQAGFAVLKSPDIPSILVETGFITNRDEERNLKSNRYQQKLAKAIYKAIKEYQQQTPYRTVASYAAPSFPLQSSAETSSPPAVESIYHTVVSGDSLSEIAARYGTTVQALKKINNLRGDTAVLGQRLQVPTSAGSAVAHRRAVKAAVHTVVRGDSLSIISQRYNVTMRSLKAANNLHKDTVYIGQKLKIPGFGSVASIPESARTPRTHKVKPGDTLSEIALQYGSSMSKIMQENSLSSRTVMLGQTLKIPN